MTTTYLSVTAININQLNAPIKRYNVAVWIKGGKKDLYICFLQRTHIGSKDTHNKQKSKGKESKGKEKDFM